MKQTPQELFEQLSKEFGPKKSKEVINEELGKVVELKPLAKLESTVKDPFWTKFESYLAENSLKPLVNTEEKTNTKEQEEKIKALSTKVAGTVENIDSHNYNYDPSVNNINNVNAQEMLNGIQCEINYNKELTLDEAKELAVKNLAKDPLHYVKEGQFGVKGLGYTEAKVQVNDGETYGGSGYSEKIKEGSDEMELVKESKNKDCGCDKETISESLGQVVTTGNPNSLAAMSGQVIRQMMAEKEGVEEDYHNPPNEPSDLRTNFFKKGATKDGDEMDEEKKLPMDEVDTMEAKGKDMDGDGDIDSDDYLAARDKAIKKAMAKKAKKESIDSKLAEIGKAGEITKMEAQLEFLSNYINEKIDRVSSINEDDNLKELVDKSKMKAMQREIKLLEKRKSKMEKMYEKMTGTKRKTGIVDEMDAVSWNEKNNPTRNRAVGEREPKKVGQSTSDYAINESEQLNENDMIVSFKHPNPKMFPEEKRIPIKFIGIEKFDGSDGKYDSTTSDGVYTVRIKAKRVDGKELAGEKEFSINVRTKPPFNKITQDGTVPFPDHHDRFEYNPPKVVDFGNTIPYIKKNLS